MSLTEFQIDVFRLISQRLRESKEGYVAGGTALNCALDGNRISKDIDLFHDSGEALESSWSRDREIFLQNGLSVEVLRDVPGFKEAVVSGKTDAVLLQWTRDSAFRFFPLVEDDLLGLTLHPFDLATNKALALAGRLEPRDWIDMLGCIREIQPFGYLVWAACGKDPGYNPASLMSGARRSGHYAQAELDELSFDGPSPDAAQLGMQWHAALKAADEVIGLLDGMELGACVLERDGNLCQRSPEELKTVLAKDMIVCHSGSLKGAYPSIRG